jgi:hypothetical protein
MVLSFSNHKFREPVEFPSLGVERVTATGPCDCDSTAVMRPIRRRKQNQFLKQYGTYEVQNHNQSYGLHTIVKNLEAFTSVMPVENYTNVYYYCTAWTAQSV